MINRRKFLGRSVLASIGLVAGGNLLKSCKSDAQGLSQKPRSKKPLVISTWKHGIEANQAAWNTLQSGGSALDAVEKGVMVTEADPENLSVGLGGLPDRDGNVTLDACIMDHKGNAGSVCFLQHIVHPISVARKVMEETPHVMLAGDGALRFALEKGFQKENLLTEKARKAWEEWKATSHYRPVINIENHDTIGMLAIDNNGNISGSCTTSGVAYKMYGRVGDSPIIGAGLFVDNAVGGAVATGMGEMMMKTLGSFLIVEFMRNGMSPQQACEAAIERIKEKVPEYKEFQTGYLAINAAGETGAFAIHPGFNYALYKDDENKLIDAPSMLSKK
ncbi:MAG: N(4)-(beta-N-acetylglucosaminyl)-L-asparaginase [Bacteroidales bacterium]|nr:N(4)-(beta-N-acetylglucosaminyl)-L-asparaginase [Bacteroidales bacterium]